LTADQTGLEVPAEVIEFLGQHRTLTLATAAQSGAPRASTFLYVNEGATLYFWSRATTLTAHQIQQNPVVGFTVDHYTENLDETRGIQGTGECSVLLSGEQIARVADLFGQRFPSLSPGSTMSISFFRIVPTELLFIDNTAGAPRSGAAPGVFGADFHRERSYSVIDAIPAQPSERFVAPLQSLEASAGDTIVRQGAPADKFFILLQGEAEIIRDEQPVGTLQPGELFGEAAIMGDQPRSATLRATSDVKLLALARDGFRDLVAQALEIAPDFDRVIRARLEGQRSA
jgi:uncharacterized protein YhbP (UPF0306 family)